MALIDEYKQAIQDVLDGRAKEAPRPSELPWTEDKAATMWAGAAAELIAEANAGGSSGGGVLVVNIDEEYAALDKTWQEIHDALAQGTPCVTLFTDDVDVEQGQIALVSASAGIYYVYVLLAQGDTPVLAIWSAASATGYPSYTGGQ